MQSNLPKSFLIKKLSPTGPRIPNGSGTYFVGRSQAPVFLLIVDLICRHLHRDAWRDYLPELEAEYAWWVQTDAFEVENHIMNHYSQNVPQPVPKPISKICILYSH